MISELMARVARRDVFTVILCGLALWLAPGLRAVQPYTPKTADPLLDPWRWQKLAELDGTNPQCLAQGEDGAMWFGVAEGVRRFDGTSWTLYQAEDGLVGAQVTVLCSSKAGPIYAGTARGLSGFVQGKWGRLFPMQTNHAVNIRCIIEAVDGGIWAGADDFLLQAKDQNLTLYAKSEQVAPLGQAFPGVNVVALPKNIPMRDLVLLSPLRHTRHR